MEEYKMDFESVDIDQALDFVDESIETSVQDDVQQLVFSPRELHKALRIASAIQSAGEGSFESRLIAFKRVGSTIQVMLTDNKRRVNLSCSNLAPNNTFDDFVAFNVQTLNQISRVIGDTFIINKCGSTYSISILGGNVVVDAIPTEESRFIEPTHSSHGKEYSSKDITTMIKSLYPFANGASRTDRCIDITNDDVHAQLVGAVASYNLTGLPDCKLTLPDAKIWYMIYNSDNEDDTVEMATTKDRVLFLNTDGNTFSTEYYKASKNDFMADFTTMKTAQSITVNKVHLARLVELSNKLDANYGIGRFTIVNGKVAYVIATKRNSSTITVMGQPKEEQVSLAKMIDVPLNLLLSSLAIFKEQTITIAFNGNKIGLSDANCHVILYGKEID